MRIGRSRTRRRRLENLLDGGSEPSDPVAPLLDSARAPASVDEVAGLDTALAAFRSFDGMAGAAEGPAPAAARLRRRSALFGGFATATVTTKLLAGAAAAAAIGGVAVAAATYHGPVTVNPSSSASTGGQFSSGASSPRDRVRSGGHEGHPSGPATVPGMPRATPSRSGLGTSPPKVPNPSLVGLCNAWTKKHHPSPSDNSRAFQQLIAAAGGIDNVDTFCAALTSTATDTVKPPHKTKPKAPKPPHKTKSKKPKPPHETKAKKPKPPHKTKP